MDPYGDLFHSNKRDLPSLPDELNFDDDFLSNPLGGGVDLGAPSPASGGTSSNVGTPGSSAAQFSISTSTSASTGVGHGTYSSAPSPSAASHTSAPSAGLSLFSPTFTQSFTFPPTQQPLNNNNSSSNHAGAFATGSGVLGPASAAPTSGGQAGGVIGAVSGQLVDQHPVNFLEYRERNIHAAESAYTASSYSEQPGGGDYNDYEHQPALLHQTDDSPLPKPVAIQAFQHQSSASPVGGANQHGTMHTSAGFIAPAQTTMQAGTTPSANGALDAFESADLFDLPQTFGNMMNEGRPRQMRHGHSSSVYSAHSGHNSAAPLSMYNSAEPPRGKRSSIYAPPQSHHQQQQQRHPASQSGSLDQHIQMQQKQQQPHTQHVHVSSAPQRQPSQIHVPQPQISSGPYSSAPGASADGSMSNIGQNILLPAAASYPVVGGTLFYVPNTAAGDPAMTAATTAAGAATATNVAASLNAAETGSAYSSLAHAIPAPAPPAPQPDHQGSSATPAPSFNGSNHHQQQPLHQLDPSQWVAATQHTTPSSLYDPSGSAYGGGAASSYSYTYGAPASKYGAGGSSHNLALKPDIGDEDADADATGSMFNGSVAYSNSLLGGVDEDEESEYLPGNNAPRSRKLRRGSQSESVAGASAYSASSAVTGTGSAAGSSRPHSKRFVCPHPGCGRAFARNFNMQSHLKSHLGIREFDCPHCPKKFSRKHDRARHCAAVHHDKSGFDPAVA